MKILFLTAALFLSSNCADRISAVKNKNVLVKQNVAIDNSNDVNANNRMRRTEEAAKIDHDKRKELDVQNEKFRQTPEEFKDVDFENFKYPITHLKNGKKDERNPKNPLAGGQTFTLSDVFYIDLNGDRKKEAVVMLYAVGCGASCDGGKNIIYFYSPENGKAKLLDQIDTGSKSSGCSLKSLVIKNKKIITEQFGRCLKKSDTDENQGYSCKFCVRDRTRSVYSFANRELRRESNDVTEITESDVMNYQAEISISE
jgi:hypothetical protein